MNNKLKAYRIRCGLSQRKLGRLAGVSQSTISHIESDYYVPAVDTALKIAAVLGVTVEELFILSRTEKPEVYYKDDRR